MDIEQLLKHASPMPWRIDKMNESGVEVVDARGNLVFIEDFSFPDEMASYMVEEIITTTRANALLMVKWSEDTHNKALQIDRQTDGGD